jgi:hypothetical protein
MVAENLGRQVGMSHACKALNVARATLYRQRAPHPLQKKRTTPPRALAIRNSLPGDPQEASLTHPRSDYPSVGCVPAEPTSVSPDNQTFAIQQSFEHPSHA